MNIVRTVVASLAALGLAACPRAEAQSVHLRTNYFKVYGTNFFEVRRSIAQSKPWRENFDAMTHWQVTWKFTFAPSSGGCSLAAVSTATTIVVTMPWWIVPTNATPESRSRWQTFYQQLAAHEGGHVNIARAAGVAVQKRLGESGTAGDCASLQAQLNDAANQAVAEHREKEKEFDRATNHGRPASSDEPSERRRRPRRE